MKRLLVLVLVGCGTPPPPSVATAAKPVAPRTSPGCPDGMVWLDGATITPIAEKAPRRVDGFCLDVTEVSVGAYLKCPTCPHRGNCNADTAGFSDHPMNCIELPDARAYCEKLGKRLPTAYEWELAAHNGARATKYPWGNEPPGTKPCWSGSRKNPLKDTCKVGSHPEDRNDAGVLDLGGNVKEWVESESSVMYGSFFAVTDESLDSSLRSFALPHSWGGPEVSLDYLGFRCASGTSVVPPPVATAAPAPASTVSGAPLPPAAVPSDPQDEKRLAAILTAYPDSELPEASGATIPKPNDPWNGKQLRLAGRVVDLRTYDHAIKLRAKGVESTSAIECALPEHEKPLLIGTMATVEGKLSITKRVNPPLKIPLPNPDRVTLALEGCKLVHGARRLFGVTAAKLGLTAVPLDDLLLPSTPKPGTRVAFVATLNHIDPKGAAHLVRSDHHQIVCRGPALNEPSLREGELLTFAARVEPTMAGDEKVYFEDCQVLDD